MTALNEIGRIRRQQVVNLSITELMLILVFMAVTFSFLSKEEGLNEVPLWQKQIEELKAEVNRLNDSVRKLEIDRSKLIKEKTDLEKEYALLKIKYEALLQRDKPPVPRPGTLPEALDEIDNLKKLIKELEIENADLRKRLEAGGRGPGLPICRITSGFAFLFDFHSNGDIKGEADWQRGADREMSELPGARVLSSGAMLSRNAFSIAAAQLSEWGRSQSVPCLFRVRVRSVQGHGNLETYKQQLKLVEQYFYVRKEN